MVASPAPTTPTRPATPTASDTAPPDTGTEQQQGSGNFFMDLIKMFIEAFMGKDDDDTPSTEVADSSLDIPVTTASAATSPSTPAPQLDIPITPTQPVAALDQRILEEASAAALPVTTTSLTTNQVVNNAPSLRLPEAAVSVG
jgi:hypothetical protein